MRTTPAYVLSCPLFASAVEAFFTFPHHYSLFISYPQACTKKRRKCELLIYSSYCYDSSVGQVTAYGRTEFDSRQRLGFYNYRRHSDRLLFPLSPILNELLQLFDLGECCQGRETDHCTGCRVEGMRGVVPPVRGGQYGLYGIVPKDNFTQCAV